MRKPFYQKPARWCVVLLIVILLMVSCAGSRGSVKFTNVNVNVSASSYLEVNKQNVHLPDKLSLLTRFSYSKRIWGILYTGLTLSSTEEFANELNNTVVQNKADGIVNFTAEVEPCAINSVPLLNMLPVFPGCTIFTIKGDVVKRK